MDDNKKNLHIKEEDKIDVLAVFKQLWAHKMYYLVAFLIAVPLAIVLAFSIPKTYKADVLLAPEIGNGSGLSENISAIASMVGVDIKASSGAAVDAIYPEIYPQVIGSTPFLISLFDVPVSALDKSFHDIRLYDYLKKYVKIPWWDKMTGAVTAMFKSKESSTKSISNKVEVNNFHLTKEQDGIANAIKECVRCGVDRKTSVITISVVTQDPMVSAILADTVQAKLQEYIIDYRTKKTRNDLEYAQKLFEDAEVRYVQARQKYIKFSDANNEVTLPSFRTEQEELENDMQLRYNMYTQMGQQVQTARDKLREQTPAFTQIQPATVPLKKDGPKRMTILLAFVFFAFVFTSVLILIRDARSSSSPVKA